MKFTKSELSEIEAAKQGIIHHDAENCQALLIRLLDELNVEIEEGEQ